MPILVTADLHLSSNTRDEYRHAFMRELPAILKKHKAEALLVLGDITEEKSGHEAELVNQIADYFYELGQLCPIIILQGNHDWFSSPEHPFFGFLGKIPNVYWVGKQAYLDDFIKLPDYRWKGKLFPHSSNPEKEWKEFFCDIAFCHQAFAGATDNGRVLSGTPLNVIPEGVHKIISGDVHTPQTIDKLTYVGSPFTVDFGDAFEPRMLSIRQTGLIDSIPLSGPQKVLIDIDENDNITSSVAVKDGDILKIRVAISAAEQAKWPELVATYRAEFKNCIVHSVQPVVKQIKKRALKLENKSPKDDVEVVKAFAKNRKLDNETLKTGLNFVGG